MCIFIYSYVYIKTKSYLQLIGLILYVASHFIIILILTLLKVSLKHCQLIFFTYAIPFTPKEIAFSSSNMFKLSTQTLSFSNFSSIELVAISKLKILLQHS